MTVPAGDKLTLSEVRHKQGPKDTARGREVQRWGKRRQVCQELVQLFAEVKGDRRSQEKEKRKKRKRIQKERASKRKGKREMKGEKTILGRIGE